MKTVGMILMITCLISCATGVPETTENRNQKAMMSAEEKAYIAYIEKVGRMMYFGPRKKSFIPN